MLRVEREKRREAFVLALSESCRKSPESWREIRFGVYREVQLAPYYARRIMERDCNKKYSTKVLTCELFAEEENEPQARIEEQQ